VDGPGRAAGVLRALRRPKVLRVCRSCQFDWKVPRYFASPRTEAALRTRSRSPLAGARGRAVAARRAEEFAQVCAAYSHCPRCAGTTFSQRRLWVQSTETYLGLERY
jgi:hypothetical protein